MQYTEIDTKKFLSDSKFFEGYSRYLDAEGRYETWSEAVDRIMDMHRSKYADKLDADKSGELLKAFETAANVYKEQRILGAQRALQFGGAQLLKHNARMYNCFGGYLDRPEAFGEAFYLLLCGGGVGFSVQKHHIDRLPAVTPRLKQAKTFVIPDSIEGWATALDVLLSSYFENGGKHPEYAGRKVYFDPSLIRSKGSFISGGFKAPGPEPLIAALNKIENILNRAANDHRKLRSIEAYDILMHSADSVIAGGVRRSATICLFSPDDEEMMNAKTGNWFVEQPQRGRSNNSAVLVRKDTTREMFDRLYERVKQFGEPGFLFVEDKDHATNPCVEIGFRPQWFVEGEEPVSGWQACNLVEINGGACDTPEKFYQACEAAAIMGTLQAGYTDMKFLGEASRKIIEREALLGVSVTGWMNNPETLLTPEVLNHGAELVKTTNAKIAKLIDINIAARTTCVKPSGNASVLLMTASGIHGDHSERYFRHVQMNKESEVVKALQAINPVMVEESVWSANGTDVVVAYPFIAKAGSKFKRDMLGVKQLEIIKLVQTHWVEAGTNFEACVDPTVRHNVSNTVSVDDWDEVADFIWENRGIFSGVSLLSATGDKDYAQAPNTAVMTSEEILDKYGAPSLFASGLITAGLEAFENNLWLACQTALGYGLDISKETRETLLKRDWVRRFDKFSNVYFDGDKKQTEYCLKDVFLNHKWHTIQRNIRPVNFLEALTAKTYTDIDTMSAQACASGACEI